MRRFHSALIVVLFLAVGILYVLHFTEKKNPEIELPPMMEGKYVEEYLPIAYVNTDSLLMNYKYAIKLNEQLLKKQEDAKSALAQKGKKLEKEMAEFQRKVENNAFLSRERAEAEQARLLKEQQNLQELTNKYTNDLAQEQQKMNQKLSEKVLSYIQTYNKEKRYQFIFSNTLNDNILFAEKVADITEEVLIGLNEAYTAEEKAK